MAGAAVAVCFVQFIARSLRASKSWLTGSVAQKLVRWFALLALQQRSLQSQQLVPSRQKRAHYHAALVI